MWHSEVALHLLLVLQDSWSDLRLGDKVILSAITLGKNTFPREIWDGGVVWTYTFSKVTNLCTPILFSHLKWSEVKVSQSCPTLCNPMDYTIPEILQVRILEWVAIPLLQGIFPTQRLNLGLPQCRQILYLLNHKGSSRILEWVAYPFSRGSSQSKNQTRVSCIAFVKQLSYQGSPRLSHSIIFFLIFTLLWSIAD